MSPRSRSARGPAADPAADEAGGGDRSGSRIHRVFVAIPLPEAARLEVAALVERVRSKADPGVRDVRWVRLDGLHVTLRFIGQVEEARLEAIAGAVEAAAAISDAFDVTIRGGGAFPSLTRPRALWLSMTAGSEGLAATAGAVEDALAASGFERSTRPFRAHLTLARSDGVRAGPDVARRLVDAAEEGETSFTAGELVLYETHQGGGPARYEPLLVAPLRPAAVSERRRRQPSPVLPSEPSAGVRSSVGARRKEQRPGT